MNNPLSRQRLDNFHERLEESNKRTKIGILVSVFGLIFFFTFTALTSFKDPLFNVLYPKSQSRASVSTTYYGKTIDFFGLLGQQKIGEASRFKTTNKGIYHGAGVVVDSIYSPNKVYVIDPGNNRILGFNGAGVCSNNSQQFCTIDNDCGAGNACKVDGTKGADIVIGQPDFNSGACNLDNNLGFNKKPDDKTLCLFGYPLKNNTAEGWQRSNIDVDGRGNLYVPDTWNNRVLKFNSPFSIDKSGGKGDAVADFVWGQDDFVAMAEIKAHILARSILPQAVRCGSMRVLKA